MFYPLVSEGSLRRTRTDGRRLVVSDLADFRARGASERHFRRLAAGQRAHAAPAQPLAFAALLRRLSPAVLIVDSAHSIVAVNRKMAEKDAESSKKKKKDFFLPRVTLRAKNGKLRSFKLGKKLGSGGYGDIFSAADEADNHQVAVKLGTEHGMKMLQREAKAYELFHPPYGPPPVSLSRRSCFLSRHPHH